MKSQTSLAARNCRLQEWSQMAHSCNNRPIGMSVNEWCRENSITTANYYYDVFDVVYHAVKLALAQPGTGERLFTFEADNMTPSPVILKRCSCWS